MKITDILVFELTAPRDPQPGRELQSLPLHIYPEVDHPNPPNKPTPGSISAMYVEAQCDEGFSGIFGPIDRHQAFVISNDLREFLIGRDPLATEYLYDLMLRLNRHGRSGLFMTGLSAIDCALWDLKGKAWEQPIYRLLGGPTRSAVPAYASMLGFSIEPGEAARLAKEYQAKGYQAQKWFFRYGPAAGAEGMAKNIAMAKAVRAAVGPEYMLMFDAFMSWNVSYATKILRALESVNPTWMEEPIPPERVSEFAKLKASTSVPIATGEHVYTRWQSKELLVKGAVDYLQNDPDWTGGITELVKICSLASAFETPVVAHGHSLLSALHVAGAQSPAVMPMVEYLINHQPNKQFFHRTQFAPENGSIKLPGAPGLGIDLDEAKIERRASISF
ncbi:MAG: hypothetical protein OXN94_05800 [Chloroflexota bacterium]|nr:hypothetical protein [Chloroflexota bacterium]